MAQKFVLEERPETEVYLTDSGFIGIRQKIRSEETVVLLTPDDAEKVIVYLRKCLIEAKHRGK